MSENNIEINVHMPLLLLLSELGFNVNLSGIIYVIHALVFIINSDLKVSTKILDEVSEHFSKSKRQVVRKISEVISSAWDNPSDKVKEIFPFSEYEPPKPCQFLYGLSAYIMRYQLLKSENPVDYSDYNTRNNAIDQYRPCD